MLNFSRVFNSPSAPALFRYRAVVGDIRCHRNLDGKRTCCRFASKFTVRSSIGAASSDQSFSSGLTAAVGSPAVIRANNQRDIQLLSYAAFAAATSATLLFFAAIPTLLAFKRATESLDKLMETTREELPSTMAAIRLSGMELSDLTMELSDISQGITQGVRSSTQAVHLAGEKLKRLANINSTVTLQEGKTTLLEEPIVAKTTRGLRQGIIKGRGFLQVLFLLTQYTKSLVRFFISRAKS